ncbi:NAD(P)H quinone oxidoreductase, PIG3 family [Gonapodya prolifera JEL478]|uniref:NAD(P)H quinone oxidoreductase, PIG3 family n=1 Tax=Gonapodya prolifera (strain JEL478) TaxID=1344416 RepID=A0A139AY72_GONPJ|nr:NAD(P)H quinone oxidoreductase, PIG3 family [Gonapodya prolifera JEL478]|eukprot:KXS21669.1 NAD(P)H quinone oxidoreductase, PIG3 family [Gonapodya prolifera JEL478]
MSSIMRAVTVKPPGGLADLAIGTIPRPSPRADQLLVKVAFAGLNRADTLQRSGAYPPPADAPATMGLEVSGEVVEIGAEAQGKGFKVGDNVCGLVGGGGYAEYCAINIGNVLQIPRGFSLEQAAAIPEVFMTAYQALIHISQLKKGEDALIHAGASGVGTAAIQLAKSWGARRIIVTAGTDAKCAFTKSLGATHAINYKTTDWKSEVLAITEKRGVDVIIDFVAGSYFNSNLEALAVDGRMTILALLGGPVVEKATIGHFLRKRLRVEGSTLRSRSKEYQAQLAELIRRDCIPKFESGELRPVIDTVYAFEDIAKGHQHLEEDKSLGKVLLRL